MAPPCPPPALSAVVLTLLAMGVMNGAQAKPVGENVPVLDITSSLKLGHPIFGDTIGPFATGQQLTLTCSTQASDSVSLSWLEGDTEQKSSAQEAEGIISSSFTIQTLRAEDSGRKLTCKDKQTNAIKDIELLVSAEAMDVPSGREHIQDVGTKAGSADAIEIMRGEERMEDGGTVAGIVGQEVTLNCVVQGYNPVAVSWWEGGTELESVATKSTYATSSLLSIKALTVDDSRRSFTCRSLNGQLSKTVSLVVDEDILIIVADDPGLLTLVLALVAGLLVIMIAAVLGIYFCKRHPRRKLQVLQAQRTARPQSGQSLTAERCSLSSAGSGEDHENSKR